MIDLSRMQGVIFDLDGTLLDSMGMWSEVDREYLLRFGRIPPDDLQRRIEGFSVPETAQYFKDAFSIPDSIDEIIAAWNEMAREEYLLRLPLKEGAGELVRYLAAKGVKLGIATTNYRDLTEGCLVRHGIQQFFSAVVTSAEIQKGKPDPEIFLKAAQLMDLSPAACVVLEDLPAGLLAGRRAGMQTVAVWDRASEKVDAEKRRLADEYVKTPGDWLKKIMPECSGS